MLVFRVAGARGNRLEQIGFYAATLTPLVAFAIYGLTRHDLLALALGFFGFFALFSWRLMAEFRYFPVYRGLCQKILAHERAAST